MKTYHRTLDGRPVDVFFPDPGDPALATFRFYFPAGGSYGFDVESTAFDPEGDAGVYDPDFQLRLVQFATEHYAWVLRMDDPACRAAARDLLADPNVSFDSYTRIDPMAVAVHLDVDCVERTLDSHWLAVMTDPDPESKMGHRLGEQLAKHLGADLKDSDPLYAEFERLYREENEFIVDHLGKQVLDKNQKPRKVTKAAIAKEKILIPWGFNHVPVDNEVYVTYAGLDAIAVRRLRPALLKATRVPGSVLRTERFLAEQAIRMQQRGMRVDTDRLHDLMIKTKEDMAGPAETVAEMTGFRPEQPGLIDWMTEHGVEWAHDHPRGKPTAKNPDGAPSLAKDMKSRLLTYPMPGETRVAVQAYVDYMNKLDRKRTTEKIARRLDANGYLHPEIIPLSCRTGRMSGREPNIQNISKSDRELRGLFLPPEGGILVECDFSQVEPRVAAAMTREERLIELIMSGENIYKITMDELGIDKAKAKLMQLSVLYGVGGNKLGRSIGVSTQEAYDLIEKYWRTYSSAKTYWNEVTSLDEVELVSGAIVPSGHYANGDSKNRANLNTICQGNGAVLFKGSLVEFGQVRGRAEHNWLWLHDANIIWAPEDNWEPVVRDLEESMNFDFRGVPISASADLLIDEQGVSRWMSGDDAKAIAAAKQQGLVAA